MTHKEQLITDCLNTKEGRNLLFTMAIKPAVKEWSKNVFSKFSKKHKERWMDTAFRKEWRTRI